MLSRYELNKNNEENDAENKKKLLELKVNKVEKKNLELETVIENDKMANTQMEIKVLKNLCEEEAKLRRDLQTGAVEKNLKIEQLKI